MIKGYFLSSVLLVSLLSGCATPIHHNSPAELASNFIQRQEITATTNDNIPSKRAQSISLYTNNQSPHTAYKIIGKASVSKFNLFGMRRQEETVNQMIKKLAASIGGDGLINIHHNENHIEANVIAFQKILI